MPILDTTLDRDARALCTAASWTIWAAFGIDFLGKPNGEPVIPNGLALCKIHHAAFDSRILGIRPDLTLHIRRDILEEVDGPMLRHGLQDMHNQRLMHLPVRRWAQPDPSRIEARYEEFLAG